MREIGQVILGVAPAPGRVSEVCCQPGNQTEATNKLAPLRRL